MKVSIDELKQTTKKAILHYGYTDQEAEAMLEVMMYAQLRGNNQGVVKLIANGIPQKPADITEITIEKETKLSALVNGGKNPAMVVVNQAVDMAIEKAKEHGMSVVGVNHINSSSGAIGFYARKIAMEGLVGFIFAGSPETVATHGSFEPIFGTNPLAIGIPIQDDALVLDMATAAMAYFGVVEANTAGRQLPPNIAYDKDGNITTEPSKVLDDGALRTFDQGYKGAGLSMMVQILTGPLIGASYTGFGDSANNWAGHFVMVFDPELLGGKDALREGVTQMIEKVKSTKKLPGVDEIYVPSERGDKMTEKALADNEIEIEDNLYNELKKVANN